MTNEELVLEIQLKSNKSTIKDLILILLEKQLEAKAEEDSLRDCIDDLKRDGRMIQERLQVIKSVRNDSDHDAI